MNKKGFIYVITAGLMISVLFLVFFFQDEVSFSEKKESELKRISLADDFVSSFNQDLERALSIATFRSMLALEEHVVDLNDFLYDVEPYFIEVLENGTINGSSYAIVENSSLKEYLRRINVIAEDLGLIINVSVNDVFLGHADPWHLDVSINASVLVFESADLAYWNYSRIYNSIVPIENLRDPMYSVNTRNRVPNTVRKFDDVLVSGDDISGLVSFLDGSFYIASDSAPSFIQRFSNDLTPSEFGIESVVNVLDISDQNLDTYPERVKIDYIYFNNLPAHDVRCNFQDVPVSFYLVLPLSSLELYQLTGIPSSDDCS
jgi:hypothetical protein